MEVIIMQKQNSKLSYVLPQILLCILLCLSKFHLNYATNETDRLALLAFKNSITEDPLNIMTSWNDSIHFCSWPGVSCSTRHPERVTVLELEDAKLAGGLTPHIANLSFLRGINLMGNSFRGEIPREIGRLSRLIHLNLTDNHLEGKIPTELGKLSNLRVLQLSINNLTGTIPSSIYNISSLHALTVAENKLQGTIERDTGFRLPNLEIFFVTLNQFTGPIPDSLSNASGLRQVSFSNNYFTGSVPSDLGSLRSLKRLVLGYNHLETVEPYGFSFLTSLTNCSNLQLLDIGHNRFTGELPVSISNFSSTLNIFSAEQIFLSGSIPEGIGQLVGLTQLTISWNSITGEIPAAIGKLKRLEELFMSSNRFSGAIPSSIGNLTNLSQLYLSDNNLNGSIPSSLGNCQKLELLFLFMNNLTGTIPKEVASLSSMALSFKLSQNSLTGRLPPEVGNMTKLANFDVSQNKLSGEIPSTLSNCLMLTLLRLGDNLFEGSIPSSFSKLTSLYLLNISRNNISGKFPTYLQNFTYLENLDLSFNDLEGEVPQDGVFRNTSEFSIAGNRKLCGGTQSLGLPTCQNGVPNKHRVPIALRVVLPVSVSCILLVACLYFNLWRLRKMGRKSPIMVPTIDQQFPNISYLELSKATNEFSPSNLIGEGSYGSVYKGILGRDEMIVAVKVLNLQQKGAAKSFVTECNALRNIRHRNLISVITTCASIDSKGADFKAIIYEYMPNGSLDYFLHRTEDNQLGQENLSLMRRISIAIDIASAVEYLHHHCHTSIIHGDLKPSNVLLDHDMIAHVGDFGLAKILYEIVPENSLTSQINSTGIRGTVGYVAPEYGMGVKASMQGDVYSFGILLLELFTGKRPTDAVFTGDSNIHLFVKEVARERVTEIVDPLLLSEVGGDDINYNNVEGCLNAILRIGVSCSMESPTERMDIREVVAELCKIKDKISRINK